MAIVAQWSSDSTRQRDKNATIFFFDNFFFYQVNSYRVKLKPQHHIDDELLRPSDLLAPGEDQDFLPYACEACGSGDREHRLLLCDACDLAYHMECLVPALDQIPPGMWYCPVCAARGMGTYALKTLFFFSKVDSLTFPFRTREVRRHLVYNRREWGLPFDGTPFEIQERVTIVDIEPEVEDDLDGFIVRDDEEIEVGFSVGFLLVMEKRPIIIRFSFHNSMMADFIWCSFHN